MRAKIPLGRFGKAAEIADLVLFLASPASDLIAGQPIVADNRCTAVRGRQYRDNLAIALPRPVG